MLAGPVQAFFHTGSNKYLCGEFCREVSTGRLEFHTPLLPSGWKDSGVDFHVMELMKMKEENTAEFFSTPEPEYLFT